MAGRGRPKGSPKNGGRKKGTSNKSTEYLQTFLDDGFNPFEAMRQIAVNPKVDFATRLRASAELAQYCAPKKKAIEHSGPDGSAIEVEAKVQAQLARLTDEELEQLRVLTAKAEGIDPTDGGQ